MKSGVLHVYQQKTKYLVSLSLGFSPRSHHIHTSIQVYIASKCTTYYTYGDKVKYTLAKQAIASNLPIQRVSLFRVLVLCLRLNLYVCYTVFLSVKLYYKQAFILIVSGDLVIWLSIEATENSALNMFPHLAPRPLSKRPLVS